MSDIFSTIILLPILSNWHPLTISLIVLAFRYVIFFILFSRIRSHLDAAKQFTIGTLAFISTALVLFGLSGFVTCEGLGCIGAVFWDIIGSAFMSIVLLTLVALSFKHDQGISWKRFLLTLGVMVVVLVLYAFLLYQMTSPF